MAFLIGGLLVAALAFLAWAAAKGRIPALLTALAPQKGVPGGR